MSAYAKGPWTLLPEFNGDHGQYSIIDTDGAECAAVTAWIGEHRKEAEANARLVSAAPELLEALQSLNAFVGVMVGRGPEATIPDTITTPLGVPVKIGDIMRDAAAALAKAEGRTP